MTVKEWIEVGAAAAMAIALGITLITRRDKGIGARQIQFTTVFLGLPIILILGLEKALPSDVTGTLLGAVFGYVLATRDDRRPPANSNP